MQNDHNFNKLFKNRKAQSVLPYTIGFVLFNVFVFILIASFARDPLVNPIGSSGYGEINANESETSDSEFTYLEGASFFSRFTMTFFDLPWWILAFITMVNFILLPIIIMGWIRGV